MGVVRYPARERRPERETMNRITALSIISACSLLSASCTTGVPRLEAPPNAPQTVSVTLPLLVPLEELFDNPAMQWGGISPDGRWLSYMKAYHGKLNVYIRPAGNAGTMPERAVTRDTVRPIPIYWWSADGRRILYLQDKGGDEAYHLFAVDVSDTSAQARDLTPFRNIEVEVLAIPPRTPDTLLITLNKRDPSLADAYRLDLRTGALELAAENPGTFLGYAADGANQVRVAYAVDSLGRYGLYARDSERAAWRLVRQYPVEDKITPVRFHPDGRRLYMLSNQGVDLSRLVLVDLAAGEESVVHTDPQQEVDIHSALFDDATGELLLTKYVGDTARFYPHTADLRQLLSRVWRAGDGAVELGSATRDRGRWVVTRNSPTKSAVTYLYEGASGRLEEFYRPRPWLDRYTFADMRPITFRARDGLIIHGYLTVPPGVTPRGLPLVLLVHGGPWERDTWQFQSEVQLLANRGYAVLQVNYRGSTGYGKRFARAAKKEFGRAMHTDLLDGVQWAVESDVVDPARVAIMGGSYGGYAALVGLTFTPDAFKCVVDYAGTSNLVTLLESFPPSWRPFLPRSWYPFVGDPRNPADREDMLSRSPLLRADSAKVPLLIFQGANDPRVTQTQADQMARALHARGVPVTYLLASNEGHGFGQAETGLAVNRATELFLGKCLGGRVQDTVSPNTEAALRAMRVDLDTLRATKPAQ